MKTQIKLSLYFISVFFIVLLISLKQEYRLSIKDTCTASELDNIISEAKKKGLEIAVDSISYKENRINSIRFSLKSESCQSEFRADKPFNMISISVGKNAHYKVVFDT